MDGTQPLSEETAIVVASKAPLTFEPVAGEPLGEVPEAYRGRIVVDTIHDGDVIPPEYLVDEGGRAIDPDQIRPHYELDRDWGASLVAARLAGALGLEGWYRVNVARVLMDYGRFPGSTPAGADYLRRFAINYPFSSSLGHEQKQRLLEEQYDGCSETMENAVRGKLIKLACHTYDRRNASGTVRPDVSLVTRSLAYQTDSRMPIGVFDPLYPDMLAEFTADRILTDRISLNLEIGGIPVAHNYPYCLPEGSIEVRAQVWFFFDFVRRRFESERPATIQDPAYRALWGMLLDTNRRSTESDAIRGYLHQFRKAPPGLEGLFREVRLAYEEVRGFIERDGQRLVTAYRYSEDRPSTIAIEVRKDLVWELAGDERPIRPKRDAACRVAEAIASAILQYLREDRPGRRSARPAFSPGGAEAVSGIAPDR